MYHARGFRGMKFGFFLRMKFVDTLQIATEHRIVVKSNVIKEKEGKKFWFLLSLSSILSGEIACYFSFLRERTLENIMRPAAAWKSMRRKRRGEREPATLLLADCTLRVERSMQSQVQRCFMPKHVGYFTSQSQQLLTCFLALKIYRCLVRKRPRKREVAMRRLPIEFFLFPIHRCSLLFSILNSTLRKVPRWARALHV